MLAPAFALELNPAWARKLPGTTLDKKKEPFARFAVKRTLFDLVIMLDNERSAQGKVIRNSVRDFCPALNFRHRARYQRVEQRSSHRKSRE